SVIQSARVELEVASRVRHPGVARVYALGTEPDGNTYIVQEFVAGPSLRSHMADQQRPAPRGVLVCLAEIAYALEALHSAGVCHRDLKPDNVILRDGGKPVLIDFGVAHFMAAGQDVMFGGTLEYSAPEQLAGKAIDGRADLYALGVIAFEWLCGLRPLVARGHTPAEVAREIGKRAPPSLLEF